MGEDSLEKSEESIPDLNELQLRAIQLIKSAKENKQLTDEVPTGIFKRIQVYDTQLPEGQKAGVWIERETLAESFSGLSIGSKVREIFGEDLVTEVGVWIQTSGETGMQYIIRRDSIQFGQITNKGVERPAIVDPSPEHLDNIQSILKRVNETMSTSPKTLDN